MSNQSILREINSEYSWETLVLKLLCFGHLMQRANSLEKTLMPGKTEGERRKGWQRMRQLHSTTRSMDMSLSKLQEIVKDTDMLQFMGCSLSVLLSLLKFIHISGSTICLPWTLKLPISLFLVPLVILVSTTYLGLWWLYRREFHFSNQTVSFLKVESCLLSS